MAMKVGIGNFEVLGFCPDKKRLSELLGIKIQKEIIYHTERTCRLVAMLKEVGTDFITFATFEMEKVPWKSKLKNIAFVNVRGDIRWGKSEDDLPSKFYLNGDVRPVYRGEDTFYDFLRCWMVADTFNEGGVLLNRDKWFLGNFHELNGMIGTSRVQTIGASVLVQVELGLKEKNLAWTKKFCPGVQTEHFRNQVYGEPYLKKLREQDAINKNPEENSSKKRFLEDWEKLLLVQNDPVYPCPYYYHNGYLKVYTGEDNLMRTNNVIIK